MKELAPLQLLDVILATLNTISVADYKEHKKKVRHFELLSIIESNNFKVEKTDFALALEKLVDDGYVKNVIGYETNVENPFEEKEYPSYSITFKGRIFCSQKGYEQEVYDKSLQKERVDKAYESLQLYQRIQNCLLILVAVGTAVAGIYYGIGIGKYYHWWK